MSDLNEVPKYLLKIFWKWMLVWHCHWSLQMMQNACWKMVWMKSTCEHWMKSNCEQWTWMFLWKCHLEWKRKCGLFSILPFYVERSELLKMYAGAKISNYECEKMVGIGNGVKFAYKLCCCGCLFCEAEYLVPWILCRLLMVFHARCMFRPTSY